MNIEFDAEKDRRNIAKHGISLAMAALIDWSKAVTFPDDRRFYGEERFTGYGRIHERLHCVIYTYRGSAVRIISLRKANQREVLRYGQAGQTYH